MQNFDIRRPARLPSEAILLPADDACAMRIHVTTVASARHYPWPDTSKVQQHALWSDQPERKKQRDVSLRQAALRSLLKPQ